MTTMNTRRDFLKWTGAGLAGTVLSSTASSYASVVGANDRVRVGIVGFSDRFRQALLPAFQAHAKDLNFEFVALSDIWKRRREEGAEHLGRVTGKPIAAARNNEELYDRKDVDAVIVATADFQHAQHGLQAVSAGRDAYVEKPMAWRTLGRFAKPYGTLGKSCRSGRSGAAQQITSARTNSFVRGNSATS